MTNCDTPDLDFASAPFHLDANGCRWVEDTLASMSVEQKVGQLFVLLAMPATEQQIDADLAIAEPAGYMQRPGTADDVANLSRFIQSRASVPMLIAANLETGANGLATDATAFGTELQMAATDDETHAYRMGLVSGSEAYTVGCRWSFSPVADIQFNPANPITLQRAFGSDPARVARMSAAFVRGLQESGVAACVKHWPGDGVDDRDQHLVTTVNSLDVNEWDESFGTVYRAVIDAGAMSVMAAHISLPYYSKALRPDVADADILPASLAEELTENLLRGRLGFRGLVATDATAMAGMQIPLPRSELVPRSVAAGCDVFLFTIDYEEDYRFMLDGFRDGIITLDRLDEAVSRVLALKAAVGLHQDSTPDALVPGIGSISDSQLVEHRRWATEAADRAVTLVKDREPGVLPLDPSRHHRVLVYSLRSRDATTAPAEKFCALLRDDGFEVRLFDDEDIPVGRPAIPGVDGAVTGGELLDNFDAVIYLADVWATSNVPTARIAWAFRTGANVPKFISEVPTIFISFGSPYHLQDVPRVRTFINAYDHGDATIHAVVDKIRGRSEFHGVSPVDPFCGYWDARL